MMGGWNGLPFLPIGHRVDVAVEVVEHMQCEAVEASHLVSPVAPSWEAAS